MTETTPPPPGLSPVKGKSVTARFDGGSLSPGAGLLTPREVERRRAACTDDPRTPSRTLYSVADVLRFRMMMIAAGYEGGIDANARRSDPIFKMALERTPEARDRCSRSTVRRLEFHTLLRTIWVMASGYGARSPRLPPPGSRGSARARPALAGDGLARG